MRGAVSTSQNKIVRSLLIVGLTVGGGLAVVAPAARSSAATCAELGWTGGDAFGSSRVCGASDAPPLAGCVAFASWAAGPTAIHRR